MSGQIDQRHLLNKCLVVDLRRSQGSGSGQPDDLVSSAGADEEGFAVFKVRYCDAWPGNTLVILLANYFFLVIR